MKSKLRLIVLLFTLIIILNGCNPNNDKHRVLLQDITDEEVNYDSNVVPIDWSLFNVDPVEGELADDLIFCINNANKYALNKWWTSVKHYDQQEAKEYLTLSGNGEQDIRSVSEIARVLAVSIKLNIYDEAQTGVTLARAEEMTVKLVKSLAKAHKSNTKSGWGDHWQSAFWAADVGFAGWLLWDKFSTADQEMIQKTVIHEADRFINYDVPYYMDAKGKIVFKGDTKAEENAWNANILTVACVMMPNQESYNIWMYKNLELIISSLALPSDVGSDKAVNGFVLKDILKGSNINSDGTVVNHNIIHPDYQTSVLTQNMTKTAYFAFGGLQIPNALIFNSELIYRSLIDLDIGKFNAEKKGLYIYDREEGKASARLNYPNGTDWGIDRQLNFYTADVFAHIYNLDKNCSVKARDFAFARMEVMKSMQARTDSGQYYMAGDSDKYALREEWVAFHLINTYLVLWAKENNLINLSNDTFLKPAPLKEASIKVPEILFAGNEYDISYSFNKDLIALPKEAKIMFTSSDKNVAYVKNNKFVTVSEGTCDIILTVKYGDIEFTSSVTVNVL